MKEHEEGAPGDADAESQSEDVDVGGGGDRHASFVLPMRLRNSSGARRLARFDCRHMRAARERDRERQSQEAHVRHARYEHCGVELQEEK